MKGAGIYIITNEESGKVYIGSTVALKKRWGIHRSCLRKGYHHNPHLQAAWDYYGKDAFEFGILEYLDDPEELHLAEQFWMDVYREEGYELYNFGLAARSPRLGVSHTKEARRKIGKKSKGHKASKETRRKMGEARRGQRRSEETCRRIGEANAGPYPAFIHRETDEIIPAGMNLSALCRERGLSRGAMRSVVAGERSHYMGWMLLVPVS